MCDEIRIYSSRKSGGRNLGFFIRRIAISLILLGGLCSCSIAQEAAHIDGLCLFDSDHTDETLYLFPPDKRSLDFFHELLAKSGKDLTVVIRAGNVPEAAAAENGNEKLLLYNQFA